MHASDSKNTKYIVFIPLTQLYSYIDVFTVIYREWCGHKKSNILVPSA